jgi:predicted Zn-dependent peptidase
MKLFHVGFVASLVMTFGGSVGYSLEVKGSVKQFNGWTLVSQQSVGDLAYFEVVIRTGSLSDPGDLHGLANLTAHALLRGTQKYTYNQLTQALEKMGAQISVSVDYNSTTLSAVVLSKNLDSFMDLLSAILSDPGFFYEDSEVDRLKAILTSEIKNDTEDPRYLAGRALVQTMYKGTGMEFPSRGTVAGLAKIKASDVRDFFKTYYSRQNMVVGVNSSKYERDITTMWEQRFNNVLAGVSKPLALPASVVKGRKAVIVDRQNMTTTPTYVSIPGVGDGDKDMLPLEVANFVFGADFTSRLVKVLRADKGWTYGAYSSFEYLTGQKADPGLFSIYTFPSAQFASLAVPKAVELLVEYQKNAISQDELTYARDAMKNSYPFQNDTSTKKLGLAMREVLTGRKYIEDSYEYSRLLNALTLTGINQTVANRLNTDNMVIAVVGDAKVLQPILAAIPGVTSVEVVDVQP